uniref:Uncharacterized protein n=1 Tax=Knipowitschia caucasica TaxID=637954 RepID=A0AAV2KHX6_KNICA
MKTCEGVLILCVLATVTLSTESAHQRLDSIYDLKRVDFGGSVPTHSLLLLYWFANNIDINDNVITLNFNPNGDFGSHHYGNYEGLLEQGYHYYTIGNLNFQFPEYVRNPPDRQYQGGNLDRIIVGVQRGSYGSHHYGNYEAMLDPLPRGYRYYTWEISIKPPPTNCHKEHQGTRYDPEHTYHITIGLLQQIRRFSVEYNPTPLWQLRDIFDSPADDSQLRDISNIWASPSRPN